MADRFPLPDREQPTVLGAIIRFGEKREAGVVRSLGIFIVCLAALNLGIHVIPAITKGIASTSATQEAVHVENR